VLQEMRTDKIVEQLIKHEGLRLKPYKCTSGKLTIGIGRNLEDNGITKEEALYLLYNDIDACVIDLYREIPLIKDLNGDKQEVLVNMCFNLGINRLLKFKKFLSALKSGDFKEARKEMLNSAWAFQVGNRALELADIIYEEKEK